MSVPISQEVSRNSGQNHRDGTRARDRESGHVPSRFPSRDARPECPDSATKVLETRMRDGLKWRRLRTASGRTYWTVELPETVLRSVATQNQLAARLARWQSGEAKRERIAAITEQALAGVKPEAIALMFPDLTRGQVFKHCRAAKLAHGGSV